MIDTQLAYDSTGTVAEDREQEYGPPEENLAIIAGLWSAYLDQWIAPQDVAQMMVLVKVARTRNGYKRDNYVDAIGYSLIAESLQRPWSESK